jgi:hypothetical protein
MYANLVLFRNELKNKNVSKYKIIGIVTELILSKEVFKKNSDIASFIQEIFSVTMKDYILKSRTMIVAHICRIIVRQNEFKNKDKLLYFISEKIEEIKNT